MNFLTPVLLLTTIAVGEVFSSKFNGPTALPVVLHSGYLADTHEVAAAKSAHLATLSHQSHEGSYEHHGHSNLPHVLQDGHIADTHEVAAAKAEHYSAVEKARAHGGYHHGGDYSGQHGSGYNHHSAPSGAYNGHDSYHGAIAKPVVLHDGHIADTHEVAAAKAEHYAAVEKARAHGGNHHGGDHSGQYAAGYDAPSGAYNGYGTHDSYHGDIAKPVVLPSGFLADTHEVAHAKQHHIKLLHSSSRSEYHNL